MYQNPYVLIEAKHTFTQTMEQPLNNVNGVNAPTCWLTFQSLTEERDRGTVEKRTNIWENNMQDNSSENLIYIRILVKMKTS